MKYRRVGASGLQVSEITLGNWKLNADSKRLYREALDNGITTFDTANVYQSGDSESTLGEAIKSRERSGIVVMTKCYFPFGITPNQGGLSRKAILTAVDDSLRRLGTDYIDVYQAHNLDLSVNITEMVDTFNHLIDKEKILYWGVSNLDLNQVRNVCAEVSSSKLASSRGPISNQIEFNLINRRKYIKFQSMKDLGILTYSPLSEGLLSGKYFSTTEFPASSRASAGLDKSLTLASNLNDRNLRSIEKLREFAASRELTPSQVALSYVLNCPNVSTVIIGLSNSEQLKDNIKSSEIKLSKADMKYLEKIFPENLLSVRLRKLIDRVPIKKRNS